MLVVNAGKEGVRAMAASASASRAGAYLARGPTTLALWSVALGGCAAAAGVLSITAGRDEQGATVDAALVAWIILSYVGCGLMRWTRRPENRFGPLMIAAGFGPLLSRLSEVSATLPQTVGEVCRLLPIALFLHVFLAFPTGRLTAPGERVAGGWVLCRGAGVDMPGEGAGRGQPGQRVPPCGPPAVLWPTASSQAVLAQRGGGPAAGRDGAALPPPATTRPRSASARLRSWSTSIQSGPGDARPCFLPRWDWSLARVRDDPSAGITFAALGLAPIAVSLWHCSDARSRSGGEIADIGGGAERPSDARRPACCAGPGARRPLAWSSRYWLPEFGDRMSDHDGAGAELPEHQRRSHRPADRSGDEPGSQRWCPAGAGGGTASFSRRLRPQPGHRPRKRAARALSFEPGLEELDGLAVRAHRGRHARSVKRLERDLHYGA